MFAQELSAFLKGMSICIQNRAPTLSEWQALLDFVEKNNLSYPPQPQKNNLYSNMFPIVGTPSQIQNNTSPARFTAAARS